MKDLARVLSIIFTVLTFAGIGYVLYNKGAVNAGYAVVPMVLTVACQSVSRKKKENDL